MISNDITYMHHWGVRVLCILSRRFITFLKVFFYPKNRIQPKYIKF